MATTLGPAKAVQRVIKKNSIEIPVGYIGWARGEGGSVSDNPTSEELAAAAVGQMGDSRLGRHRGPRRVDHDPGSPGVGCSPQRGESAPEAGRMWVRVYAGDGRVVAVNGRFRRSGGKDVG